LFALAALLCISLVVCSAALGVPAALWREPGLADPRGEILEAAGLPTPQLTQPPAGSAGEGWYRVHFTTPRYPDRAGDRPPGIDRHLVDLVARAERSVDVAAYEINLDTVADALLQASERGVAVRLVTDTDNLEEEVAWRLKRSGVPVVSDERAAIMHHKFVVVDDRYVWTGSWNLTVNCTYRNNNNAIVIDSVALARSYAAEFGEMYGDGSFGPRSPTNVPPARVTVDGTLVESYFAPEDRIAERLVALVGQAQGSVRFMAFSFTDQQLAQTLIDRARAGVDVSGVVERRGAQTSYAQYPPLREAGIDVLLDGNPYVMHHKVIIIDEAIVVTGSFNFSESADRRNDENVLIIYNPEVARHYLEEFARVRRQALEAEQP
jgi:phosphatidylserine/phosphatidylglycerophosphate/cardiolipin synthase-like enzyme